MNPKRAELTALVQALTDAAEAVHRARRIRPDLNLDHASERLRAMIAAHAQRLLQLDDDRPEHSDTAMLG